MDSWGDAWRFLSLWWHNHACNLSLDWSFVMNIDQRALEAAYQAVSSTPNDSGDGFMFHDPGDAWKVTWRAIEAYEAAKPSPWRIVNRETKNEGSVLIWLGKRNAGITWPTKNIAYYGNGKWNTDCNDENLWHVATFGAHSGQFTDEWLIEEGAMFCKIPLIKTQ